MYRIISQRHQTQRRLLPTQLVLCSFDTRSFDSPLRSFQSRAMSRNVLRLVRVPLRTARTPSLSFRPAQRFLVTAPGSINSFRLNVRNFSLTSTSFKGLSPESENPQPKEREELDGALTPTEVSIEAFHELSDIYLERIIAKFEELQEDREDVDVEYSVCLLLLGHL